ncbi:TerB family tellurite resistance protein [Sphaerotilus mobilis]|uniref:Tellurite resistance protein TerB n=1 Tax=Sphaerotilus mobilis TaxID=47994 RepID=A0A4Q7LH94_9BURK|nr:TerB family tellurite resistance protein [Sphaerotilus mobilis]RZS53413.1 hypothetical protein EV685_3041 [Sphaerotilus mobilis]
MRPYPRNSPEAAARIVCLAMLADGELTRPEIEVMESVDLERRLHLSLPDFYRVLEHLCDDLSVGLGDELLTVDDLTVARLMDDIDDPALRRIVLDLCRDVIECDAWVSDGEALLLNAAVAQWGLHRAMFDAAATRPRAAGLPESA